MPTVLRIGPYRFGFFSADVGERPHVHVRRNRSQAKFWIGPIVELEHNSGFAAHELNVVCRLIEEHRQFLLEQWHDYFNRG
jgi:hypothetical protein